MQLRRYAWSAQAAALGPDRLRGVRHLRLPRRAGEGRLGPTTARLDFFTYEQLRRGGGVGQDLLGLLSRGGTRRFPGARTPRRTASERGTQTVDAAFLRRSRAGGVRWPADLASRNDLNPRQLNYAVQMTIDRIIFLRMAEDRGIEEYGRLLGLTGRRRRLRPALRPLPGGRRPLQLRPLPLPPRAEPRRGARRPDA